MKKRKRNIHTVFNKEKGVWQTKLEGQESPLRQAITKRQAMKNSVSEARKRMVEHVIHNKDGKISDSDSYGPDPYPPKDKIH